MTSDFKVLEGTLRIERDYVTVALIDPWEPDPTWRFTDAAGHDHHWDGPTVPTLEEKVTRTYWCVDCCDEHEDSILVCKQCGQEVSPGTRRGPEVSYIPTRVSYYLNDEPISEEQAQGILGVADANP